MREVIVERDRAVGVILDNGETVRAKYVASSVNPKLLYTRLLPSGALAPEFLDRIRNWRNGSGTFRMNVALNALPSFTALPGEGDHLTAGIIIGPSLGYMDRAWQDARNHGWSREPVVEVLIPSTLDDSLCPPGQHVASLFCQHVAPQLPDGRSWDDHRDEVADLMIATVDNYAPGFAASVIGRQMLSPLDLERQFGLLISPPGPAPGGHQHRRDITSHRSRMGESRVRYRCEDESAPALRRTLRRAQKR